MQRFLSIILCLLLLSGCTKPAPPATTARPETTTPPTLPPAAVEADVLALREGLPTMDGSTSLIPLETGIRAALLDISEEEAAAQVVHSSTWNSFYNLLDGAVQVIFTTPPSQEQWDIAAERGVELEAVPIAMEGFVFVVNADNPVDTLTQEQLRGIYSGSITNWSEVGGEDLPIIPYQRNNNSGSQNYMIDFMGDAPLMDAPKDWRPASMEGLMDVIAVNDNAAGAIGYSVYAYAADMYGNGDEIKFIQVDGVAPGKQTMASGEYPLLGENYAIFRAEEPEDSIVRTLVRWMTSYDGQLAIARAGYVTPAYIGFDYQEQRLSLWQGTGAGPAAEAPAAFEWNLTQVQYTEWGTDFYDLLPVQMVDGTAQVVGLTDDALTAEINAFIAEQMEWVPGTFDAFEKWVTDQNRADPFGQYSTQAPWEISAVTPEGSEYTCIVTAKNGCLSVAVSVCGTNNRMGSAYLPYRTETATWDLRTGKRLSPEELFCQGVDVDAVLNDVIRTYAMSPMDEWGEYPDMKQDFAGLPMTGWHVTHEAIYIDHANPYFATGERIPLENLPEGVLVCDQLRDFGDAVDHGNILVHKNWRILDRDNRYAYNSDALVSCGFLKEEVHPNASRINALVMDYLDTHYTQEAITKYYTGQNVDIEDVEIWMLDWDLWNLGGRYLMFQGSAPYHMAEREEDRIVYPHPTFLLFDLESGRQVPWTVLVRKNWREGVTSAYKTPDYVDTALPAKEMEVESIHPQADGSLNVTLADGYVRYSFTVPYDYVNYE
ncbi:MAG: substrate-binding domain-containing protein [Oscillospiraceae bacterium]|nr:substrate-binding domain-containing protein [Oscillospiraceae bacterium]